MRKKFEKLKKIKVSITLYGYCVSNSDSTGTRELSIYKFTLRAPAEIVKGLFFYFVNFCGGFARYI